MQTSLDNCNQSSLDPYIPSPTNPWDRQKANHVYRRLGFGAPPEILNAALNQNPTELIDQLVDEAINLAPRTVPIWGYWVKDDFQKLGKRLRQYRIDLQIWMINDLLANSLRERLTLFWSNHFVTQLSEYEIPSYAFQYYNLLQRHSIGNFKTFTHDIGISPAMLGYLNGNISTVRKPNENYSRELYELFTLGVNNGYTQKDIEETSRALTGWNKREIAWGPYSFDPKRFDHTEKTIFGRKGNWEYKDVIDILFEEKPVQISEFIVTKLYKYFVSPTVSEGIVKQLAETFRSNNFELAPVLRRLFKSEHFFDIKSQGAIIKSPIDLYISFFKETQFTYPDSFAFPQRIRNRAIELKQELLEPVDVAGWPGDEYWIDTNSFLLRWEELSYFLTQVELVQYKNFVINLMGGNSNDVVLVTNTIMDTFFPQKLANSMDYEQALVIFKDEVPVNYFEDGTWDLNWISVPKQVHALLQFIIKTPEFQLK
ncbi:hypothetical protein A8C32_03065 [Flavivirga aquatica]|uniref:DUF1800 domain-containing protein n=1 Tax=Flavivirga aquatica TaxID=1849968 RepID=A0A1E5TAQ6_9FLAO|nr:DUF1800 domain-containing protein [Flavivirga aquatica]OEK08444.1 hypothetical protein A8C32_03065 [Flavivirga aquatica]